MGTGLNMTRYMPREKLADYLRELARAVEGAGQGELSCAEDFYRLKLSVRDEYGQLGVKLKVRSKSECVDESFEQEALEAEGLPLPKYGRLKKRMKASFKVIFQMLGQGAMPPRAALDEFLRDAGLMVRYPGYGEEHYEEFSAVCVELEQAVVAEDVDAAFQAAAELARQKGRCHAQYD